MAFYQSAESILIQASAEKIYEALTDWRQRTQWRPGLTIQWEGSDQAHVNQVVRFQVGGFPPSRFKYRIAGLEPSRRIYMEYTGWPLRGRSAIEITASEPEGSGCQVAFHWMKVEPVGFWAKLYFTLGLGMADHRRQTLKTLGFLKTYLEKDPRKA
ncbi:MAG: SRPBCC family protein [bacterium]